MSESAFLEYRASTAAEFLDYLRLTNEIWHDVARGWRHQWLFRGQGSATHPLTPSVWRTDSDSPIVKYTELFLQKQDVPTEQHYIRQWLSRGERFKGYDLQQDWLDNATQLYFRTRVELKLINSLFDQALLRGISIPDYSRIRQFLNDYMGDPMLIVKRLASKDNNVLDSDFEKVIHNNSFFALAQHHGIPTRLLDWTTSPYIAAFFAAESALHFRKKRGKRLAVFAAHETVLHVRGIINYPFPKSDNPYLHAQKGELTSYKGSTHFLFNGKFPTVDEILSEGADWNQQVQPIKITLPVSQAAELLRLLAVYEGIGRDQLMPTFDNIVHVVKQRYELDMTD